MTGDFNLPDIEWDKDENRIKASPNYSKEVNETIINLVNEHNLQQCNNILTRGSNILDLVFTTNNNLIENITVEDGISGHQARISGHQAVIVSIKTKVKTAKKKPRKIFMYSKGNMPKIKEQLKDKLQNYIIGNREKGIDNCWESFKDILISLMTQNIPQKNCTSRWSIPWINKR